MLLFILILDGQFDTHIMKIFLRIILLLIGIITIKLKIQNHIEYTNTPSGLGVGIENMFYAIISLIISLCICFIIKWKKMTIVDYLLFFLCTPFISMFYAAFFV